MNLKEKAKQIEMKIPAVFLALKDPRTPAAAKIAAGLTVAYALSPVDLIPDFIPVLGYLDDLVILPLLLYLTYRLLPEEVLADCTEKAKGMWADGKPEKWYYAVPIVLTWAAVIAIVLLCVLKK